LKSRKKGKGAKRKLIEQVTIVSTHWKGGKYVAQESGYDIHLVAVLSVTAPFWILKPPGGVPKGGGEEKGWKNLGECGSRANGGGGGQSPKNKK